MSNIDDTVIIIERVYWKSYLHKRLHLANDITFNNYFSIINLKYTSWSYLLRRRDHTRRLGSQGLGLKSIRNVNATDLMLDLGVTWHYEIQLTWNFFNSLSNLVGNFFQLASKFCDSLFDLGLNGKIVLSHSKRKQVHAVAETE